MDLKINNDKKKRSVEDHLRIKWGSLNMASALDIGDRLVTKGFERVKRT